MSDGAPARRGVDTRPDPLIGSIIAGKYLIQSLIAKGGMGKVYRAEQQPLGRVVALKLLHVPGIMTAEVSTDAEVTEKRFFREASILARLQHPNIVTVYDFGAIDHLPKPRAFDETQESPPSGPGEDGGRRYFMAMEYISGETLHERLARIGKLSADETVRIARQIGRGLREAHALGIIHRDLKPLNLMITVDRDGEEQVKILDFGIVKLVDEHAAPAQELTYEGLFVGSPMYMAPEQVETGKVDARSDVYSLGVVLYRCLTGGTPFPQGSTMQIMMAHLKEAPAPLRARAPDVPVWLEQLVDKCLQKDAARRPQTMDEVLRSMNKHAPSGSGAVALPQEPLLPRPAAPITLPPRSQTVQGSAKSVRPSPQASPAPKRGLLLYGIPVALVVIGVAIFVVTRSGESKTTSASSTSPSASSPAKKKGFTLLVDSSPQGAEVFDGDRLLGVTPLTLPLDNDSLRDAPRTLSLRSEGHRAYSIVQGPSDEDVHLVAVLVPVPTPTDDGSGVAPTTSAPSTTLTKPTVGKPNVKPPPTSKPSTSVKSPPPPPTLDIQLKR